MKSESIKQEFVGKHGRLIEINLLSDGFYYFVYEKGIIRLSKIELKTEERQDIRYNK
jgi:hypothetical protein